MEWKKQRVFVTGADGFIGGWVAKTLVDKGAEVIVIIRDAKINSSLDLHNIRDKVTIVKGDIKDYDLMKRIFNEYEINYCFHLAAQALVTIANRSPISTFETNVQGTWSILEAIRVVNFKGFKGIVIASSDKAYGIHAK